jgi:hypothetical protein
MSIDAELASWRRQWRSGPDGAAGADAAEELTRRVLRDTRWMKLGLIAPVLVTFGIGGPVVLRALRTGQVIDAVLAVECWLFIVVTWAGCLWLARGTWRPLADTTAAFVDISIRRREANIRSASFGACLYVLQFLFIVLVKIFSSAVGAVAVLTSPYVILLGWLGLPLVSAWMVWFRRRQRAQLEHLRALRVQLSGD